MTSYAQMTFITDSSLAPVVFTKRGISNFKLIFAVFCVPTVDAAEDVCHVCMLGEKHDGLISFGMFS